MTKITITHNGKTLSLDKSITATQFLEAHGYTDKLVALAINSHFIPRSAYSDTDIKDNDTIEIVAPMQGG